ncbi:uncharacterized protein ACNLHF_021662 [Anomaloglossus baeobatrachus]|uniref:uncharacterized protein LOC142310360 n=1 Tax=Anomaloglossus baeobatrachus TaxID=238106 RepID=UPI003F4F75FF
MRMFLSSLVPVLTIIILVPGEVMPDDYINGTPPNLDLKVGQSATISCIVKEDIDIRELQFGESKTKKKILNLTMDSRDIPSKLSFSGSFEKFQWIVEEKESSYVCTDETEKKNLENTGRLEGNNQIDCPVPKENSTVMFLKNGTKQIASFWINSGDYRSRMDISGTFWNLKITLHNLKIEDTGSYECTGKAEGIKEELLGTHTFLTVRAHGIGIYTGNLGLAFAVALASVFL